MAALPTWLDLEFVQVTTGVLAIAAVVVAVTAVVTMRSLGTRLVIVALMGAAIFGLMRYRDTLDTCDKTGCECKLLGENLQGGGCSTAE